MTEAQVQNGEWICLHCGATVDADFEQCWNCGHDRDGTGDPTFQRAVKREVPSDFCPNCGYPRKGLDRMDCPECGTNFEASPRMMPAFETDDSHAEPNSRARQRHSFRLILIVSWVAMVPVMAFVTTALSQAGADLIAHVMLFTMLTLLLGIPLILIWSFLPDNRQQ